MRNSIASAVILLLALARASIVLAQDGQPSLPTEPKAICESMLGHVLKSEFAEAFAIVRATSTPNMEEQEWNRRTAAAQAQFKMTKEKFGEPLGWNLVRESQVNETLQRYVYLFKYESGVTSWEFVFYRPRDVWKLHSWGYGYGLDVFWPYSNQHPVSPPDPQPAEPPRPARASNSGDDCSLRSQQWNP